MGTGGKLSQYPVCKCCGFNSGHGGKSLGIHVKIKHNLSPEQYYLFVLNKRRRFMELETKDKLDIMFELQDKLNGKFGVTLEDFLSMPEEQRLQWVRNFSEAAILEIGEVLKAAKSRWWKKDKDWQGNGHLQEECVDLIHFVFSICLAAGMSSEDVYRVYLTKNKQNHVRPDWKINEALQVGQNG